MSCRRAVLACLCLALLSGGCGGPERADAPTTEAVSATVTAYYVALARADGRAMCAQLTEEERETLAGDAGDCTTAATSGARAIPRELRVELARATVDRVEVDGDRATARVRIASRYASKPRTSTLILRRQDGGAWRISNVPSDDDPDPVTTCVASGLDSYQSGKADPLWQREGRADFLVFLRATCQRGVREGAITEGSSGLSARQRETLQRIYAEELRKMIQAGRIEAP